MMLCDTFPCKPWRCSTGAATASAGVLIVGTYTGTKTPKGRTVEFRIQDGRGKITSQPGQVIYYDHAKRTAYIVDTEKGTSFEMNEARAKQMASQLARSAAHDGGEAQGAAARQARHGREDDEGAGRRCRRAGGGARHRSSSRKTGSAKVGEWPCERYTGHGRRSEGRGLRAPSPALGISAADIAVFEGFLDLSEKMAGEAAAAGGIGAGPDRGFPGLPLERSETRARDGHRPLHHRDHQAGEDRGGRPAGAIGIEADHATGRQQ